MLTLILSGLIGCTVYHRDIDGTTTVRGATSVRGADMLVKDELAGDVLAKATTRMPVSVDIDANGTAHYRAGGYGYGYNMPSEYVSAASGDLYLRGQQMLLYRAQRQGGTYAGGGTTSGEGIDPNATCPKDRSPLTKSEAIKCHDLAIEVLTDAVESNPAVRQ